MDTSDKPMPFVKDYLTGRIIFRINGQNIDSEGHKYLYVPWNVEAKRLELTKKNWLGDRQPSIIVVIASDGEFLSSWTSDREVQDFKTGLMKAAKSTHMVIITNGTNFGASKIVSDAVNFSVNESRILKANKNDAESYKINVIGLSDRSRLSYDDVFKKELVYLDVNTDIRTVEQNEERKYKLDPNLTHYVIVKEDPNSKFGVNSFTSRFLQILANPSTEKERKKAPIVFLLIQGSGGCANLIREHLEQRCSVIIFKGSGGLADLLAFAFEEMEQRYHDLGIDWDQEFVEETLKPELKERILRIFPKYKDDEAKLEEFRNNIIQSVYSSRQEDCIFIQVLTVNNPVCELENLSEYLLKAILKSQRAETSAIFETEMYEKYLKLSIDWNCPEVAKTEVIYKNAESNNIIKLDKELFMGILCQPYREEFVDIFLTQSFKVHKFLTPKKLRSLYKFILKNDFFKTNCWERILGQSDTRLPKDFIDRELNWLIEECTGLKKFVSSEELSSNILGMYSVNESAAERKALAILAIWAIFANKKKLVKVLWKHCDNPIHLGLIISTIYGRLSLFVSGEVFMEEFRKEASVFISFVLGVLDECYQQSTSTATEVLKEESSVWNYKTAVDLAANSKFTKFFAHPCCQKWLTNTFNGKIRFRDLNWGFFTLPIAIKVLVCAFLVFPMYIWVRFQPTDYKNVLKKDEKKNIKEKLQVEENKKNQISMDKAKEVAEMSSSQSQSGAPWLKGYLRSRFVKKFQMFMRELIIQKQPPLPTMIYSMWTSPVTKFYTSQFFYIIYLVLFSAAVFYPSCGVWTIDLLISSWTLVYLIESIHRTIIFAKKFTFVPVLLKYFEIVGIFIFVTYYIISRIFFIHLMSPYSTKIFLCFGLLYAYYRLFAIFMPIGPAIGPLLYKIKLMITIDFVNFWKMAILVLLSSGITIQALLYPDGELDWELFRAMFHRAFFSLFVTPIDELSPNEGCDKYLINQNGRQCNITGMYEEYRCPNPGIWPWTLSIQYFIFLKIVLINLLYAMFAITIVKIDEKADVIWKFQRYSLVIDFAHRLGLPAPLSIFIYLLMIYGWIRKKVGNFFSKISKPENPQNQNIKKKMMEKEREEDSAKLDYWLSLAKKLYEREEESEKEKEIPMKEWEYLQRIGKEVEIEKKKLRHVRGQVHGLERVVSDIFKVIDSIEEITNKK